MAKELTEEGIDGTQRYLLYDNSGMAGPGLFHNYHNLRCFLLEASLLRRIAVIQNLRLNPKHNFGVPVSGDPERYCTLPPQETGQDQQPIRWIRFEEFEPELKCTASSQIRYIGENEGHYISQENDRRYKVIVRKVNPGRVYRSLVSNWLREGRLLDFSTMPPLPASKEVKSLAEVILKSMGLSAALSEEKNRHLTPTEDGFYACLHLRWSDRAKQYGFVMRQFLTARAIRSRLNRIADLPRGSHLYIMSDHWDRGYFDLLKRDYKVWRYYDFPQLRSLVPDTERGGQNRLRSDNFFLFAVELELMRRAAVRVQTEKKGFWLTLQPLRETAEKQHYLFQRPDAYRKVQKIWRLLNRPARAFRKCRRSFLNLLGSGTK